MKEKKALGLKFFIGLFFTLIVINMFYNYFQNKHKQDNIYNVMGLVDTPVKIETNAFFVFDEYVLDSYEDTNINIKKNKVFRSKDPIIKNSPKELSVIINKQKNILDSRNEKKALASKDQISQAIYNKVYSSINLDFLDSINKSESKINNKTLFINSYIANQQLISEKTGYYKTKLDGYETLINANNLDLILSDSLVFENLEKDKLQTGLKFVNNKEYYVIIEAGDLSEILNLRPSNLSITIDKTSYNVAKYDIIKNKFGNIFIKLTMHEGIEEALEERKAKVSLDLANIRSLKIPTSAIYEVEGQTGVYTVDTGVVEFAPVKILYRDKDMSCIETKSHLVLSQSYLDLVKKNNENLLNDRQDKNYIKLLEIGEFSNILLDKGNYKVGDRY